MLREQHVTQLRLLEKDITKPVFEKRNQFFEYFV